MKKKLALTALIAFASIGMASADETGLSAIHAMKYEKGRRICMTEHFHDGSGNGKTRKDAESRAMQSWIDFTAFEYGSSWGSYKLAASQTMDCQQNAVGWACMVSARPCKRYVKSSGAEKKSASR